MEFTVAAYTDIGTQKEVNQDSLCIRRAAVPDLGEVVMAVVCDGMGGLEKGELASGLCAQFFGTWFDQNLHRLPTLCCNGFQQVKIQWNELLQDLHHRLSEYAGQKNLQLGTTASALLACGDRWLTVNIGDSRVYMHSKHLEQLTQDQSLVAREIALGHITEEEARHHPQRNILLQCLGSRDAVTPIFTEGILPGDALLLLCSDGFVHELSPQEMEEALQLFRMQTKEAMTQVLTELMEQCKIRGEGDNITAVLIKTAESSIKRHQAGIRGLFERLSQKKEEYPQVSTLLETAQIVHIQGTAGME